MIRPETIITDTEDDIWNAGADDFPAWCRIVDLELEQPGFHDGLITRLEARRAQLVDAQTR